jgi:uncharacterized protein (TIGR00725 family)
MSATRPLRVAVCGGGTCDAAAAVAAENVGRLLAEAGAVVICGGLGGVMDAAARGAAHAGGITIGVLPGRDGAGASEHLMLPLATGMGEGRNMLVVRFAEAVIAVGGEWGTLSEVALAMKIGVPVVGLDSPLVAAVGIRMYDEAAPAVADALSAAARYRGEAPRR